MERDSILNHHNMFYITDCNTINCMRIRAASPLLIRHKIHLCARNDTENDYNCSELEIIED
jgi:hypothetical protein